MSNEQLKHKRNINQEGLPALMSSQRAAKELNVCKMTINNAMKRHGLGIAIESVDGVAMTALTPDDVMFLAENLQVGAGRPVVVK